MPETTTFASDFDYMDAERAKMMMTDLRDEMIIFFATDDELEAMEADIRANACIDWAEYDINDRGYDEHQYQMIGAERARRRDAALQAEAMRRYQTRDKSLTWNPFMELLSLHGMVIA